MDLRSLRARYYYSALDAVYMAPTRAERPPRELLRDALGGESAKFERVGAFAGYLTARAPRWMARLQRRLECPEALPIRGTRTRRLGYGTRSSCVILEGSPPRVLKFIRCSLGCDLESMVEFCRYEREEYETLKRWYAGIPRLFPHTIHLVLQAPMLGLPAAGEIQDLVVGEHRDLLDHHSDDELVAILGRHAELRANFHRFVVGTRRAWDEEGRFLDMVGLNNVLLLETSGGPELRVPDFGIWDLERQKRVRPDLYERAREAMQRLERIDERAGSGRAGSNPMEAPSGSSLRG